MPDRRHGSLPNSPARAGRRQNVVRRQLSQSRGRSGGKLVRRRDHRDDGFGERLHGLEGGRSIPLVGATLSLTTDLSVLDGEVLDRR